MNSPQLPIWDGVTPTARRYGVHRNTVLKIVSGGAVDARRLGIKILIRQTGPRSMEAYYEQRLQPAMRVTQSPNLARGTAMSAAGLLKRKRRQRRA
jgi:hypothetical protein